jgi:ABC-type phosphate/phosphonate transport system substrate-binding protein
MKRSSLLIGLFAGVLSLAPALAQDSRKISIGITPTLVADLSLEKLKFIGEEFPLLVKEFTGLVGTLERPATTMELAAKVADGKDQFGVFQGIEFAEAQTKHPELQPILLTIYRTPEVKAILVAKNEGGADSFAALKGQEVAVLKEGKEHIRRYAQKEAGGDAAKFFSKVVNPATAEAALDAVLQGKVQAAVVDSASFDQYKEVNPGRFRKLKIIGSSPVFPPSVIACNPNKVDAGTVKTFQDGMLKADQTAKGRDVMGTFKISSFQPVPADFEKSLTAIRQAYAE